MSTGYFPKRTKLGLEDLFHGLVSASHILSQHSVLTSSSSSSGQHISVRSPDNPKTFWMPCNMPAALVSVPDDLVEYYVDGAEPVEKKKKKKEVRVGGGDDDDAERYIHSEIYKKFPGVNSVVVSRAAEVMPFCVSGVGLRCCVSGAGFLGSKVPLWDASNHYPSGSKHSLSINNTTLAASLAATFKPATSTGFIYSKVRSALPPQLGGATQQQQQAPLQPDHAVVLMQNHGFVTVAHGIEEAVYQAILTKTAAKTQSEATLLLNAHSGYALEGKVDVEGGGKIKSGFAKPQGGNGVRFLTDKECHDSWENATAEAAAMVVQRSWALWCRQVEVDPLYRNECPRGDDEED